jgi:hypothetical protein
MTTSGTVSFSVSRDDICKQAMYECGALGIGETMSDDDLQLCSFRLNMMVKQYMGTIDLAPGLKVWSRKRGNLFLSTTTGQYSLGPSGSGWCSSFTSTTLASSAAAGASTIIVTSAASIANGDNIGITLSSGNIQWTTVNGAPVGTTVTLTAVLTGAASGLGAVYNYATSLQARRPLQIITAVLRDVNTNDTPLWFYNLQDYESLPSKANLQNTGDPTQIFYEAQLTNGVLYTDVAAAADTSKYIHIVYLSPIEDFNSATDTPDYPQEWYRPLVKALAVEIAPAFSLPVTQEMMAAKAEALAIAGRSNPETSTMFFQPKDDGFSRWGQF